MTSCRGTSRLVSCSLMVSMRPTTVPKLLFSKVCWNPHDGRNDGFSSSLCKGLYAQLCPFLVRRVECQVRLLIPDWISFESADTTAHNTPAKACSSALNALALTAALQAVASLAAVIAAAVGARHQLQTWKQKCSTWEERSVNWFLVLACYLQL